MSTLTVDARAVVAAVDRLTTQVKRLADAQSTPVAIIRDGVTTPLDAPTTTADDGPGLPEQTPDGDEGALRTARRDSLLVLLSRAGRMRLSTDEAALLRQHVETELRDADTARAVAAGNKRHVQLLAPELDDLQARITKARALHASHAYGSAECTQRCERRHPEVRVCNGCGWTAPCPTARALDGTDQPTT